MKLIYIEWEDSMTRSDGWWTLKEAQKWAEEERYLVRECGWLIKEDKEFITLSTKFSDVTEHAEKMYCILHKIPRTWIRKRVDLTKYIR